MSACTYLGVLLCRGLGLVFLDSPVQMWVRVLTVKRGLQPLINE